MQTPPQTLNNRDKHHHKHHQWKSKLQKKPETFADFFDAVEPEIVCHWVVFICVHKYEVSGVVKRSIPVPPESSGLRP
jgi:hypothetical protein